MAVVGYWQVILLAASWHAAKSYRKMPGPARLGRFPSSCEAIVFWSLAMKCDLYPILARDAITKVFGFIAHGFCCSLKARPVFGNELFYLSLRATSEEAAITCMSVVVVAAGVRELN